MSLISVEHVTYYFTDEFQWPPELYIPRWNDDEQTECMFTTQ